MTSALRHELLGIHVDLVDMPALNVAVQRAVESDQKALVANHNLHSVYLCRRDPSLTAFFDAASLVHIDGMPLVWIARSLGIPARREHRTTYVDWFPSLIELAERLQWRVFYCGSRPGVAKAGIDVLRGRHPTLQIRAAHGYLDLDPGGLSSNEVLREIREFRPQLLFVGMGMPRQEHWIHNHWKDLAANVILPCGAAIDYVAGAVPTPPRWLGRLGLEWAFRLFAEPRRLGVRYLVEPWALLIPVFREIVARRSAAWRRSANDRAR